MDNNKLSDKDKVEKLIFSFIKPILMKVPWMAGVLAFLSFFITASIIQIIIGAIL